MAMTLTPEEAHAVNRLMDPEPKTDPLRRYVALYRTKAAGVHLGHIAHDTQLAAWTIRRGPNTPADLEILDVIEVRASEPRK
jgi:hypothetical protein